MRKILFTVPLCFFSIASDANTQTDIIDREVEKNIAATTGVITFLTSQESVSGGIYRVGAPDNPDSEFTTFKLPYRHTYKMHDDGSRWSMLLGYGRFDMKQEYDLDTGTATSTWEANSISTGVGYSNRVDDSVRWFSHLELAYTQIYHRYKIPTIQKQIRNDDPPMLGNLKFNWHTDTLSIIPSIGLKVPVYKDWYYQPKILYLHTESIFEEHDLEQVSASSGLIVNRINFGEPWTFHFDSWGIALNPQLNRSDALGAVGDGLQTSFWYEVNLNFRLKSYDNDWWDGLEYGFSVLHGEHFNGGQLSIGFSLDRFLSN